MSIRLAMNDFSINRKVVLCTFSNFKSGAFGDATNDRKLFFAIPSDYKKIVLYPKYSKDNDLKLRSILKFLSYYLKEIIASNNILITHGSKLAILPILLKFIFKNKVILRLGCTPLMFVERKAFLRSLEFESRNNFIIKILIFFESIIEKFALRHADRFIVENNKAKKIISFFGAAENKIKIIPYYVQDYFLECKNPKFESNIDFFKLGYTGRFKKYDVLEPVINAIFILKEKGYKIKLYLIGDGPNRKKIETIVKQKGLTKNVIFMGSKPHEELSRLLDNFHCLLLPMLNKLCPSTISIKILEGVMKGKIIITTESGNNPSLFLGNTNLILNKTSDKNIAQKIQLVIENYNDYKEIAEKLSKYHKNRRSKKSINKAYKFC